MIRRQLFKTFLRFAIDFLIENNLFTLNGGGDRVTIIRTPRKLFKALEADGCEVKRIRPGVYKIEGLVSIGVNIIVTRELDDPNLSAIKAMAYKAEEEDIRRFILESSKYTEKGDKSDADAVLQIIAGANEEMIRKMRGDERMCEALREIMAEDLQNAENKGMDKGITGMVNVLKTMGIPDSEIVKNICEQYKMPQSKAKKYVQ